MLKHKNKLKDKNKLKGFTIVELLVVIVVIGILAAITIVAYTGISQRAIETSLQSDLKNASTQLKLFNVDNGGYPETISCVIADSSTNKCIKSSNGASYDYTPEPVTNPQTYQLIATIGSKKYVVTQNTAPIAYTPAPPQPVVDAGYWHTCALNSARVMYCWGYNIYGAIGDNTSGTNRLTPVAVNIANGVSSLYGKTITAISANMNVTCALDSTGSMHCWGTNSTGRLGDNTTTNRIAPVAVNTASGVSSLYGKTVTAISTSSHVCALDSVGGVHCWGSNNMGQIGDNTTTNRIAPVAVNTASGVSSLYGKTVTAISAKTAHTCVIDSIGSVHCWGQNYGQIGDNTFGPSYFRYAPVAVNTTNGVSSLYGKTVVMIGTGDEHTCALDSVGGIHCWGKNTYGQIGDNSNTNYRVPVAVNTANGVSSLYGKTVVAISVNSYNTCALDSVGGIHCWGYNGDGRLGDNTTTNRLAPVAVNTASGISSLYGKTVKSISVGMNHTCALDSVGGIHCWGDNIYGAIGDNTTGNTRLAPVDVSAPF